MGLKGGGKLVDDLETLWPVHKAEVFVTQRRHSAWSELQTESACLEFYKYFSVLIFPIKAPYDSQIFK